MKQKKKKKLQSKWGIIGCFAALICVFVIGGIISKTALNFGYDRDVSAEEAAKRDKIVATAEEWLGCKEADGSHQSIIDLYNSHTPLARSYAVQYDDDWCSTFASAVAIKCGMTDIIPTECGCEKHIGLFQEMDCWVEDDGYVPLPGDYIFYDWDDTGLTDSTGWSDHVGIVVGTDRGYIKVIEGNYGEKVDYRIIKVGARTIRGYGTPDYS